MQIVKSCSWIIFLFMAILAQSIDAKKKNQTESNTPRLRALSFSPFESSLKKFSTKRAKAILSLLENTTLVDIQSAMQAGKFTSEELTLFFLSRIKHYDADLRSYTEINPACLEEARAADKRRADGKGLGVLEGIPINLKDNIGTVAPLHTTAGAEVLLNHSPANDAVVVAQLRAAGAVILGKASLSELAGVVAANLPGFNAVSGMGKNPYGSQFPVWGSSSGSAISTTAFLTAVSVGTETSGSLIAPASVNGVVGMKPSLDRVSGEGIVPLVHYQDSAGPLARTVTDAAALLAAIDNSKEDYVAGLKKTALTGVSVGVLRSDIMGDKTPSPNADWLAKIDEGLKTAKAVSHDAKLEGEKPSYLIVVLGLAYDTIGYMKASGTSVSTLQELQAYNAAKPKIRIPRGQDFIDAVLPIITKSPDDPDVKKVGLPQYYEDMALKARASTQTILDKAFAANSVEVLVSLSNLHSNFYAAAGYPAITVPLGVNKKGEPNGMVLIGKRGEDAKLLSYAYAFEQATQGRVNPVKYK